MASKKYRQQLVGSKTRRDREERQQKRELLNANKGLIDEHEPTTEINDLVPLGTEYAINENDWAPEDKRKWYVIDTNLILSCVDILYDPEDENWRPPLNFRPSLDNAHIIIPETVFDELDHMKDGHTVNRAVARIAFRRLKKFFPNSGRNMREIMELKNPVKTGFKQQRISILPLYKGFVEKMPWRMDPTDNDGFIAATALAATMIRDRLPVDGTMATSELMEFNFARKDVTLLTNDNALQSKADKFGIYVKGYTFDTRPPFTGMRELTVPAELFEKFYYEERISRAEFEKYLPKEAPLVANEFIVMTPEGDKYPRSYFADDLPFANVARYHKSNDTLCFMRHFGKEGEEAPNAGIASYYDAMNDDSISVIVVTGKAGTGKTYQIVRHSIKAVREGQFSKVILIVNSDNGVGYLPGNQDQKMEPMIEFCKDAIRSYLSKTPELKKKREVLRRFGDEDGWSGIYAEEEERPRKSRKSDKPKKSAEPERKGYYEFLEEQVEYIYRKYFVAIPYKQAQGRSFEDAIVIVDEAQRIIIDEMETFITRPARNSLLVVCGDVDQIHYNSPEKRLKNGLIFTQRIYHNWDGCANIHLAENMRHEAAEIANRNYERVIQELSELKV